MFVEKIILTRYQKILCSVFIRFVFKIFLNQNTESLVQGSITDRNDLEEFLATAELADSEFTAGNFNYFNNYTYIVYF